MSFLFDTQQLYNGDLLQAIAMLFVSAICVVLIVEAFRRDNKILKGAIFPVLIIAILYGMFGVSTIQEHQNRINTITEQYQTNKSKTITETYHESKQKISGYKSVIYKTWPILMIIGLIGFFAIRKDFIKGFGLGLMIFSVLATIGDLALQLRLETYLTAIETYL